MKKKLINFYLYMERKRNYDKGHQKKKSVNYIIIRMNAKKKKIMKKEIIEETKKKRLCSFI